LLSRRDELVKEDPNFDKKKFLYYLSRAKYQKEWGKGYRRPGPGARVLALLLRIIPKVGPFKAGTFKIPTSQSEDLYIRSIDRTVEEYHAELTQVAGHHLQLENRDCDTGKETRPGEYALSDRTYATLVDKLADRDFKQEPPELQANILQYFAHAESPISNPKSRKQWARARKQLEALRAAGNVAASQ